MQIVKTILELPSIVEFQGVFFEFQLFINHSDELRFCYLLSSVKEDSPHYAEYSDPESELHGKWITPDGNACDWLYLVENISDDETLIEDIYDCKKYLQSIGCAERFS